MQTKIWIELIIKYWSAKEMLVLPEFLWISKRIYVQTVQLMDSDRMNTLWITFRWKCYRGEMTGHLGTEVSPRFWSLYSDWIGPSGSWGLACSPQIPSAEPILWAIGHSRGLTAPPMVSVFAWRHKILLLLT